MSWDGRRRWGPSPAASARALAPPIRADSLVLRAAWSQETYEAPAAAGPDGAVRTSERDASPPLPLAVPTPGFWTKIFAYPVNGKREDEKGAVVVDAWPAGGAEAELVGLRRLHLSLVTNAKLDQIFGPAHTTAGASEDVVSIASDAGRGISAVVVCDGHGHPPFRAAAGSFPEPWGSAGRQVAVLAAEVALGIIFGVPALATKGPDEARAAIVHALHERLQSQVVSRLTAWGKQVDEELREETAKQQAALTGRLILSREHRASATMYERVGTMVCAVVRTPRALVAVNVGDARAALYTHGDGDVWTLFAATPEVNASVDKEMAEHGGVQGAVDDLNKRAAERSGGGQPLTFTLKGGMVGMGPGGGATQATASVGDITWKERAEHTEAWNESKRPKLMEARAQGRAWPLEEVVGKLVVVASDGLWDGLVPRHNVTNPGCNFTTMEDPTPKIAAHFMTAGGCRTPEDVARALTQDAMGAPAIKHYDGRRLCRHTTPYSKDDIAVAAFFVA